MRYSNIFSHVLLCRSQVHVSFQDNVLRESDRSDAFVSAIKACRVCYGSTTVEQEATASMNVLNTNVRHHSREQSASCHHSVANRFHFHRLVPS